MDDDTEQLLEMTRLGFIAFRNSEPALFEAFLASDFYVRTPGEPDVSRAAFLEWVRSPPATIVAIDGEAILVRVLGDAAVVTGVQRARLRIDGQEHAQSEGFTHVFERRDGRWQAVFAYSVPWAEPAPPAP